MMYDVSIAILSRGSGEVHRKKCWELWLKGLSIIFDTNLIETDILDVSFNLNTEKYFFLKETE